MEKEELIVFIESKIAEIEILENEDTDKVIEIAKEVMSKVKNFNPDNLRHPSIKVHFEKDKIYVFNELLGILNEIKNNNPTYIEDNFWFVKFFMNGSIKFLR